MSVRDESAGGSRWQVARPNLSFGPSTTPARPWASVWAPGWRSKSRPSAPPPATLHYSRCKVPAPLPRMSTNASNAPQIAPPRWPAKLISGMAASRDD